MRFKRESMLGFLLLMGMVITLLLSPYVVQKLQGIRQPQAQLTQTNYDSPYGFTSAAGIDQDLVYRYSLLHVHWVRLQLPWERIEIAPGQYNWSLLDQQVKTANRTGIHITFPIQDAPSWRIKQVCMIDHTSFLPNPQDTADFAALVAKRYNGDANSQGYIDSFEVFNEEPLHSSLSCQQASYYVPVLKAVYPIIKQNSPKALVGMFGMWYTSKVYEQQFMQDMYTMGAKPYFDFANFHYYTGGKDPTQSSGDFPSFHERWQIMHNVMVANNDGQKPIWVTETGFFTVEGWSPQKIQQYMQYELNDAMRSHIITKFFWYTINTYHSLYKDVSKDLYPNWPDNNNPTPAFYTFQNFITQYPFWN